MATQNSDDPPADVVPTGQNGVSPPGMADTESDDSNVTVETGASSNNNGTKVENENEVEANREKKKHLEKEDKERPKDAEDEKSPEDALKEMQMRKTHDLYCPKCTHNITGTAKLFKKGQEATFPYNEDKLLLWFVIVISFKYPFIYIPWFYNNTTVPSGHNSEPTQTVGNETTKKHVPDWLRLVLVVVLLLLSAIVLWAPPSPPPINNKGIWILLSWLKDFQSNRVLAVISLLLLAVLAMFWPSFSGTKRTEPGNEEDATQNQKQKICQRKPGPSIINILSLVLEVIGYKKKPLQNADNKVSPPVISPPVVSPPVISPPVISPPVISPPVISPQVISPPVISPPVVSPPVISPLSDILWKYIVVPAQRVLLTELDIVKSIVYGGLIESITSFGVVSSAAASGTSTLNVMALGLANLFSGLFLTLYNLYGLITYQPRFEGPNSDHKPDVVAQDPYKELLGKRDHCILHFFVVVVSFVVFAVIPPLFYGFSFKITDKGHHQEAAVVVAASLVCVISLSFAKAYAFGMNKLKTVGVYTGIAIGASVFSFIASQHLRDLFEKLPSDYLKR